MKAQRNEVPRWESGLFADRKTQRKPSSNGRLLFLGDHCIGQTIQGRPERSCATGFAVEVIPVADHFQIDVEVIGSLPTSGQCLHGCGGQWIVIVGRGRHTEFCGIG